MPAHTHTQENPAFATPPVGRIATQVALFAGTLCLLLLASWMWVLPRFTQIRVGETVLSAAQMSRYVQNMRADITAMESDRASFVRPQSDERLEALLHTKRETVWAEDWEKRLRALARTAGLTDEQFRLASIRVDSASHTVEIQGDVRHAEMGSMTLLAAFLDVLQAQEDVQDIDMPAFTRVVDPKAGPLSPFHCSFRIAS